MSEVEGGRRRDGLREEHLHRAEKWLQLGMWFILTAWGSPLDSDLTEGGSAVLGAGWIHTDSMNITLQIQLVLLATLEIFVGES